MKANELRQKSVDELERAAKELTSQLHDVRFKIATRQFSKVRRFRSMKKDLARILTILHALHS